MGLAIITFIAIIAISYKLHQGNAFIWLPDYLFNQVKDAKAEGTVDIIFVPVDHFEPGGNIDYLNMWMQSYRALADKHLDSDGIKLQHSWYYPLEQFRGYEVDSLVQLCREGYGDVEVHLHHKGDNSESLRKKFVDGIDSLQAHGALHSPDGQVHFSFIHGNWALDNSRMLNGHDLCGVNDELTILMELGCYSDCTFPAMGQTSQPSFVNKIYYAKDDPQQPKSHDKGEISHVGIKPTSDMLLMLQGPYLIDWSDWRFKTHPVFDDGNLYWEIPTSIHRFEKWLEVNIHVKGQPNWVFVRPFTHGASLKHDGAFDNILGNNIDSMLEEMKKRYNDGKKYRLHFMTSREAYNVVKAAEDGKTGNPNEYRDYVIQPYLYDLTGN